MKRLLKNRANNIMRKAFVRGLKVVWHQRVIDRNLRVAAKFACRKRLLSKPFKAFNHVRVANQNGRVQAKRHMEYQTRYYFKMWVKRYMLGDVAVRQLERRSSSIKAWTIKNLVRNVEINKSLRAREVRFE